ncbi:DUF6492 family protein [Pseudoduganella sp. HUAS MS19]
MQVDIFIRSYYKDLRWLHYCLRSIRRYCHGFSRVIVVVPHASRARLDWHGLGGDITISCPDYADDYLGQQVSKLHADTISEADYICHVDSDCIFSRSTQPSDLMQDGKPRILFAPYRRLDRHVPWQGLVQQLLGHSVDYEFMRTPPYTFPRWMYREFRNFIEAQHGVGLEEYVLRQPARGFSEFNALGAYAYHHHRDACHWLDENAWPPERQSCRAYWSWGGIDQRLQEELELMLAPGPAREDPKGEV